MTGTIKFQRDQRNNEIEFNERRAFTPPTQALLYLKTSI